jgi:phage tail-like protein
MTEFTRNRSRSDPYRNFKFRIKWEGRYVAGVSKVSPLTRAASPSSKSRGGTKWAAITLERGVTRDAEFERWANFVSDSGADAVPKDLRRNLVIEVHNEAGQLTLAYKVFRCWVSEFQSLPDLDASTNAVTIQHIKLENEGFERTHEVLEPAGRGRIHPA